MQLLLMKRDVIRPPFPRICCPGSSYGRLACYPGAKDPSLALYPGVLGACAAACSATLLLVLPPSMLLSLPSALLPSMLLARLVLLVWPCCCKLLALKHIRWCTILPAFATAAYQMVALKAPSLVARAKPSSWPRRDTRDCFRERIQIILWMMRGRHITPQHSTAFSAAALQ